MIFKAVFRQPFLCQFKAFASSPLFEISCIFLAISLLMVNANLAKQFNPDNHGGLL